MLNKRRQLFEIQDFSWCPKDIRDGVTHYLQFTLHELSVYSPLLPLLQKLCAISGTRNFIDLCSGGGGPLPSLLTSLNREEREETNTYKACLTDLYPNTKMFEYHEQQSKGLIRFLNTSVDAKKLDPKIKGVRTLFSSFHHFNDEDAKAILKNAITSQQPLGIFEFTERRMLSFLLCIPAAFLMPVFMPLVRPLKISQLFWTYVIPLIPLVTMIDITTSIFRTRTTQELLNLTKDLDSQNYHWSVGRFNSTLRLGVVYLIGFPKN